MARIFSESEKAIMLAIEENRKTIRQLQLANSHMAGLLQIGRAHV